MVFLNHHSFLLLLVLSALIAAVVLFRHGSSATRVLVLTAVVVAFGLILRSWGAGESSLDEAQDVRAAIGSGHPVLVEIQSPYCLACAAAKPTVDRIERENPQLQVIRMNIQDPAGAQLANEFGTRVTPTFVLFDFDGTELLRAFGSVRPDEISERISS